MNRRRFLQSLSVATAAIYLRLAPAAVREVRAWQDSEALTWAKLCDLYQQLIYQRVVETNPFVEMLERRTFSS